METSGRSRTMVYLCKCDTWYKTCISLLIAWSVGIPGMADEKSLAELLRLQELGLLKGDAPSRLWLQYKEFTWVCGCAVLLVDQKLYVVQWSCEISAAHCERRAGEDGSPRRPN